MWRFDFSGRSILIVLTAAFLSSTVASASAAQVAVDVNATGDEPIAWFPAPRELDLTVRPPVQWASGADTSLGDLPREPALIPLPPAAWSGLAGLAMLTLPKCRRMLHRLVR
jgi:hypothetical protein